jgi:hypothetical protein
MSQLFVRGVASAALISVVGPSIHDLTVVAISCRPFGPQIRTNQRLLKNIDRPRCQQHQHG